MIEAYRTAYATIYDRHDYPSAIAQLKALGHEDVADVANLIGFSSRKLGRTEDAKVWYEKALAAGRSIFFSNKILTAPPHIISMEAASAPVNWKSWIKN